MRILAIDPGNEHSAWCVMTDGRIGNAGKQPNDDVRRMLREAIWTCAALPELPLLAVEMIASYGMPVGREVFETVRWIGRFQEAWEARGGKTQLIYRKDVKMHLCGSMQAKDANIRQALIDRFGPSKDKAIGKKASPGPLYGIKGDEWSALAVAVTAAGVRSFHVERAV